MSPQINVSVVSSPDVTNDANSHIAASLLSNQQQHHQHQQPESLMAAHEATGGEGGDDAQTPPSPTDLQYAVRYISIYYVPCLIVIGAVCNALGLHIVRSSPRYLRHLAATQYVLGCLCADLLALSALAWRWVTDVGFFEDLAPIWCNCQTFLDGMGRTLSVWFIVVMSTDGALTAVWPGRRKAFSTALKARAAMVTVVVMATVFFLNVSLLTDALYYDSKVQHY